MFYILPVDIGLKFSVIVRYAYLPHDYLYEPLVQNATIAVTPSVSYVWICITRHYKGER
ncbi:MAG: hypothetical protein RMY00_35700 [Nostoc sp. ChiVER01]|nr:hypothetical protein [Nostoc sp. ChiVER01]